MGEREEGDREVSEEVVKDRVLRVMLGLRWVASQLTPRLNML